MGAPSRAATVALVSVLIGIVFFYGSLNQIFVPSTGPSESTSQSPPATDTTMLSSSTFLPGKTTSSSTSELTTSIQEGLNPQWVSEFFAVVNSQRSTPLTESNTLDQFAEIRFNSIINGFPITHYGFDDDFYSFFAGQAVIGSEEYFYPNASPSFYAMTVQNTAPAHWQGLLDSTYSHYGYYIGTGPEIRIYQPCSAPLEIIGSFNVTQLLIQDGCRYTIVTSPYLVIELSD